MKAKGLQNSSITRVRPVLEHLLKVDPTAHTWLGPLWNLATGRRPFGSTATFPVVPGNLAADPVLTPRTYHDKVRGEISLLGALERRLAPPAELLRWLLENAGKLTPPNTTDYGASGQNADRRTELLSGDVRVSELARARGLQELARSQGKRQGLVGV